MKNVTVKVLSVVSKRDKFRRAGREFTGQATHIPLTELKQGERTVLENEPVLVCFETEVELAKDSVSDDSNPAISKKAK